MTTHDATIVPRRSFLRLLTTGGISVIALTLTPPVSAKTPTCYSLPFPNANLMDGWGSVCCGRTSPHRGVDFPQAKGTPIPAVAKGIVHLVPKSSCLGNVVVIEHPDGMFSGYAHMITPTTLQDGTSIEMGDVVGKVGATGTCQTGPHLHLTLSDHLSGYWTGTTVDPYAYILAHKDTCNHAPNGVLETLACDAITGWAADHDDPDASIGVRLLFGGPAGDPGAIGISVLANVSRDDLCVSLGSCAHAFSTRMPLGLHDDVERTVFAYGIDTEAGPDGEIGSGVLRCDSPSLPEAPLGLVRRPASSGALAEWNVAPSSIATLADATLEAIAMGPELQPSPNLVSVSGSNQVFALDYTTLRSLDASALPAWGFDLASVEMVSASEVADDLVGVSFPSEPFFAQGIDGHVFFLDAPPALWGEFLDDEIPLSLVRGTAVDVTLRVRNRGSMAWTHVELAPTPRDDASPLCDASWLSCTRAVKLGDVAPGAETTVQVRLQAPDATGVVIACFGLVSGAHWFSEAGANGPMDDGLCRVVVITERGVAQDAATAPGCAMTQSTNEFDFGGVAAFVALGLFVRRRYRHRVAERAFPSTTALGFERPAQRISRHRRAPSALGSRRRGARLRSLVQDGRRAVG